MGRTSYGVISSSVVVDAVVPEARVGLLDWWRDLGMAVQKRPILGNKLMEFIVPIRLGQTTYKTGVTARHATFAGEHQNGLEHTSP